MKHSFMVPYANLVLLIRFAKEKKIGRPKQHIVKRKLIKTYCTSTEYMYIKSKASKCNLSMSQFLLDAGTGRQIKSRLSTEEIEIFRQLIGMATNLNQAVRKINHGERLKLKMINDLEVISEILDKFK